MSDDSLLFVVVYVSRCGHGIALPLLDGPPTSLFRYAAYREYVGDLEQHVSEFALQEGSPGRTMKKRFFLEAVVLKTVFFLEVAHLGSRFFDVMFVSS